MSKFITLMDMIYGRNKSYEKMADTSAILDTMFDKLQDCHPDLYYETMTEFEKMAYEIDLEKAEKIVSEMKPYGQKWSYEEIRDFLSLKGIDSHCIEYYLVMNMAMNDYKGLAEMVGMGDNPDFYFEFAKQFIFDIDAKPHKVGKYFL